MSRDRRKEGTHLSPRPPLILPAEFLAGYYKPVSNKQPLVSSCQSAVIAFEIEQKLVCHKRTIIQKYRATESLTDLSFQLRKRHTADR